MLATPRSTWERHLASMVLIGIALAIVIGIAEPVLHLTDPIARNYNEGWNAFHAQAAMEGGELYPGPGTMVFNNYPPLSFYVVGIVGTALGDHIVAGRLVSLVSLLIVTALVGWIAAMLARSRSAGIFAGLLAMGTFAAWFPHYVAMNDPQLLGHAFQYAGLAVFLRDETRRGLYASMVLLLLGGLVKHNLLALPLGVAIWLFVTRRRDFVAWGAAAGLGVLAALLVMALSFGAPVFDGILFLRRVLESHQFALASSRWLPPIAPALAATAALGLLETGDRRTRLLMILTGLSLAVGLGISFADGISYNAIFDLIFVSAIGCAVAIESVAGSRPGEGMRQRTRALLMLVAASNVVFATPMRAMLQLESIDTRAERLAIARSDLARTRAIEGAVLCENAALAYWAEKPYEVDFFNFGQRVATGAVDPAALVSRIENREFGLVQLYEAGASVRLGEQISAAIRDAYTLDRISPVFGALYLPRPVENDPPPAPDGDAAP